MKNNRLEILYRIRNAVVHYCGRSGLVYSVKNRVYLLRNLADCSPVCLGAIPWRTRDLICQMRLVDRGLKRSILQVQEAADEVLLVCNGHSWWSMGLDKCAVSIPTFSKTRPMNRGICTSSTGITYVADYVPNKRRRDPIRIFGSRDLRSFEPVWEFPPGDIRHIHALIPDPEDCQRIWVLTGDEDPECRVLFTDDEFRSMGVFLSEGQRTRVTDMIIQDGNLIWGMDSPMATSFLLSASKKSPGSIRKLLELPGSAYYMTRNGAGGVYLGTTAEPGPAAKDHYGHIFGSKPDGGWEEILRRRNDPFPQRGIFYFPRGILPENYLVYSQRALFPQEGHLTVARDLAWA